MTDAEILERIRQVTGLAGMTVNERLFEAGLMNVFDEAKKNDKDKAKCILRWLGVDEPSISKIVK